MKKPKLNDNHLISIFEQIANHINSISNLEESKTFIIQFVNEKKINGNDKHLIITNTQQCCSIYELQKYIYNSLLKYEGLGMNQLNKNNEEEKKK